MSRGTAKQINSFLKIRKRKERGQKNQCVSLGSVKQQNSIGLTGVKEIRRMSRLHGEGVKDGNRTAPLRPSATEEMSFLEARQGMRMLQVRPGQALGRAGLPGWLVVGRGAGNGYSDIKGCNVLRERTA